MMISVIIPTLNEQDNIRRCLDCIKAEAADSEIIVSDGGSTDATTNIAGEYEDVTLICTGKGRGAQMNDGASAAKGGVLLFLHADTVLERGWSIAVKKALDDPSVAAGSFTLKIDNAGRQYRLIELWVKLRCAIFKLPYGDQAIFVRRECFEGVGGFRDIPLMEDVDLVGRVKKTGRLVIIGSKAITHDRRWARGGWIRISVMNQTLMLLYRMGVDPRRLEKIYYR